MNDSPSAMGDEAVDAEYSAGNTGIPRPEAKPSGKPRKAWARARPDFVGTEIASPLVGDGYHVGDKPRRYNCYCVPEPCLAAFQMA